MEILRKKMYFMSINVVWLFRPAVSQERLANLEDPCLPQRPYPCDSGWRRQRVKGLLPRKTCGFRELEGRFRRRRLAQAT
jgi:hypothetical protein